MQFARDNKEKFCSSHQDALEELWRFVQQRRLGRRQVSLCGASMCSLYEACMMVHSLHLIVASCCQHLAVLAQPADLCEARAGSICKRAEA